VRDFYFAAAESFELTSIKSQETVINSYTLPQAAGATKSALEIASFALESFNQRFTNYPYTELDLISTPMLALGMEYPGVIALNVKMFDEQAEISGMPGPYFLEGTTAHEVAHQWFYNMIGNDQQEEPWLDEAIVQYLTGIYFLDRYGEQGYQGFRQSWFDRWDRVDRQPTPVSLPASSYDGTAYGAIVYGRGPLFVEALAERMGEQRFWDFLRAYVDEYRWSIGQPEGFIQLAEMKCECTLDDLWKTWGIEP
jgi:aminopeptidase N